MKKEDNVTEGKYTLEYTEFENFLPTKAEKVITTHELAKKLNARLKPAFQDYRGCFIAPNPNGVLTVMIQFNQLRENQIQDNGIATAFKAVESMRGVGNIADRSRALSMEMSNGAKFVITDEAKQAFGPLISDREDKINWKNVSGESYQRNGFTQEGHCYISGVSILKALELIYGAKDEAGSKIFYNPIVVSPVPSAQLVQPNNWIINLQMMTESSAEQMYSDLGIIGGIGNYNCVTAV